MRRAGSDARRNGPWPMINRKTRNSDPEAGSGRWSHARLLFLRDGARLDAA